MNETDTPPEFGQSYVDSPENREKQAKMNRKARDAVRMTPEQIREARRELGDLTQTQLAKLLGLSDYRMVSRYENGASTMPRPNELRLMDLLTAKRRETPPKE